MLQLRVTDYPARGTMAPHSHEESSLIIVVSGSYLERIRGGEDEHSSGDMLLYPAHATHSQQFGSKGVRKIVFTPDGASVKYLEQHGISLDISRHVSDPIISQLAHRLLAEIHHDDSFSKLAVEGISLELIAAFARTRFASKDAVAPHWLRAARDAVAESSDNNLSLHHLSALTGKHPVHIAREFRRYFGSSIGTYRRRLRLQRAEGMLNTKADLTEIALACGFASHSHFSRSFKAAYGMTPSQFRLRN